MSRFGRHARGAAAFALTIGATVALVGCHTMFGLLFNAPTSVARAEPRAAEAPPRARPTTTQMVAAATSSGLFEELVKPTPRPTIVPTPVPTLPQPMPAPTRSVYETGVASTYGEGDGFEGRVTACGQVFHTQVVQVAHKSLPCGTLVRIEDSDSGRAVTARVTDRGPYITGRIVDLSWGAFEQLDPTGPGLLKVNVYVVDQ